MSQANNQKSITKPNEVRDDENWEWRTGKLKNKRKPSIMAREKKNCAHRDIERVNTVNGRGALWRASSVSLSLLIVTFLLFKFTTIIINIIILIPFTHYFLSTPLNYFIVPFLRPFFPVRDYSFRIYSDCIVLAERTLRAFSMIKLCVCVPALGNV